MIVRFMLSGPYLVKGKDIEYVWMHWKEGVPIPRKGETVTLRNFGGENDGIVTGVDWYICEGKDKKDCEENEHCDICGIQVTVYLKTSCD